MRSLLLGVLVFSACSGSQGPKGDTGTMGTMGTMGAKGDPGAPGPSGASGAIFFVDAGSAACASGGAGLLTDDGGIIYVCNGAPGPKGDMGAPGPQGDAGAQGDPGASVIASSEPMGANCAYGGTKFVTGGTTTYACNGAAGTSGITGIVTAAGSGLAGGATSGTATLSLASCPSGQVLQSNGSTWACADNATTYTNGAGLSLVSNQFSAAFTTAGGDNGSAATVARGDHTHDARYAPKPYTVVMVQATGTPLQNGSALIAALAGITDNSATKPYLIKLEPGVYDLGSSTSNSYQGKPYIDLEGSGRAVTTVQGTMDGFSLINLAAPSEVRELTISHTGGGVTASTLWFAPGAAGPCAARRVTLNTSNGSGMNMVLLAHGAGVAVLEDVDANITATVGEVIGVRADDPNTTLIMRRVHLNATTGANFQYGVYVTATPATIEDTDVTVTGGGTAAYAFNLGNPTGSVTLRRVTASATGTAATITAAVNTTAQKVVIEHAALNATVQGAGSAFAVEATSPGGTLQLRSVFGAVGQTMLTGGATAIALSVSGATTTVEGGSFVAGASSTSGQGTGMAFINTSFLVRGASIRATSAGGASGLSLAASVAGVVSGRFDVGSIEVQGATPANTWNVVTFSSGAGDIANIVVGGSRIAGDHAVNAAGCSIKCINDYNQLDAPIANGACP